MLQAVRAGLRACAQAGHVDETDLFPDFQSTLSELVAQHGYVVIAIVIAMESMGLPLPGEAILIAACLYAGNTQRLEIWIVLLAGTLGAIIGDNAGYWIGRKVGFPLLLRHGWRIGLDGPRIKIGQYLFLRHGGKVVFFGRFVAILRATAGLLAGANRMDWRRFLAFNTSSAVVWVGGYGLAAYGFGASISHLLGPIGIVGSVLAIIVVGIVIIVARRSEARLRIVAERAFPDPVSPPTRTEP